MTSCFGRKREDHLEDLRKTIFDRKRLLISYPSHCQLIPEERKVNPYGLICKAGVWYLVAYCHKRKQELRKKVAQEADRVVKRYKERR